MKTKQVLRLTKIKEWYFPVDAVDYKLLVKLNVPAVRINENMISVISMLCDKHRITKSLVQFDEEILNPYLEKIGKTWNKKEDRTVSIGKSTMKFETSHSRALEVGKQSIDKLEISLRNFFERWGYSFSLDYSESRGKCKLNVSYKFTGEKLPVISLSDIPEAVPTVSLKLGFTRLTLAMGTKKVEVTYSLQTGTLWKTIHTHQCLYSQIGNVLPMVRAMIDIVNRHPANDEETND